MSSGSDPRSPTGSVSAGDRDTSVTPGNDRSRRLSTETKASFKTTELPAYILTVIGVLIAGNVIEGEGGDDFFAADKVWLYVTLLTIGYMISRGLAKSGSREPYDEGR